MSAFGGGQGMQELLDAVRAIAREIEDAGRAARSGPISQLRDAAQPGNVGAAIGAAAAGPVGGFIGEALGNNFVTNTALKAAQEFGRDTAFGVAQDFAKYGTSFGSSFEQSVTANALRAGTNIPIIGDIVDRVEKPRQNAIARLKAELDPVARAGGEGAISDDAIDAQLKAFIQEDQRANKLNDRIKARARSSAVLGEALNGDERVGQALDHINDIGQALVTLGTSIGNLNALVGTATTAFGGLIQAVGYR